MGMSVIKLVCLYLQQIYVQRINFDLIFSAALLAVRALIVRSCCGTAHVDILRCEMDEAWLCSA
jgi:hypothetical protein